MGALLEDFDGRQFLAFEELEEGAAAGGNVGNFVFDAVFGDGGERVAASGNRERPRRRNCPGHALGTRAELIELEYSDRPIPDYGSRRVQNESEIFARLWTDIEDQIVGRDSTDQF